VGGFQENHEMNNLRSIVYWHIYPVSICFVRNCILLVIINRVGHG
jgi:hypothetical protein